MKKVIAPILVLVAGVLWGFMSVFTRTLSNWGIPAMSISCIRMVLSALFLWAFLFVFKRDAVKIKLKHLPFLALIGVLTMFLMSVCYVTAIETTSASVAAILLYTSPIFIFVFSIIFFREKIRLGKVVALVVAVIGCVLVSGIVSGGKFTIEGLLIGLASGLLYGLYSILGTMAMRHYSSITITAYAFLFSAILGLIFLDYGAVGVAATVYAPSALYFVGCIVIYALVTALVPFTLYTYGLSRMEPSNAGILACIEPVVATLVGIFILEQSTDVYQIIGIVLVIVAIILIEITNKKMEKIELPEMEEN